MTEPLSLERLRYAHAVAQAGSFSAAARSCGVTQPALSNGIAKLEAHLGQRLFERTTRGAVPTAFGERALPLIDRILADLDALRTEARRFAEASARSIRMGVSPLINPAIVARAYTAVSALPDPPDLVLREANLRELREALLTGDLDVILIPAVEPLPGFEHRLIDREPVVLVESDPQGTAPVELADTAHRPLILVPDACGLTTFTTALYQAKHIPVQAYPGEALSYQVLEQWATLGMGNAILPLSKLSAPTAPHRRLVDEGRDIEIAYEAVWNGAREAADELRTLTDRIAGPAFSTTP